MGVTVSPLRGGDFDALSECLLERFSLISRPRQRCRGLVFSPLGGTGVSVMMSKREEWELQKLDMNLFEYSEGARRYKLSRGRCGWLVGSHVLVCFHGHRDFDDEHRWVASFVGVPYHEDRENMADIEQRLAQRELAGEYALALVPKVCPNWEHLQSDQAVRQFYYDLATASPLLRAQAALEVLQDHEPELMERETGPMLVLNDRLEERIQRVVELLLIELSESLASQPVEQTRQELQQIFEDLSLQEAQVMEAVRRVGVDRKLQFAQALQQVQQEHPKLQTLVESLRNQPELGEQMQEGLAWVQG
jgi:hypothetical protein